MLSSCEPAQLCVNVRMERYGKRKDFPQLCTTILGNLSIFSLNLLTTIMMVNICTKYLKSILQELGSSIYCHIFGNNHDTHH